MKSTCKTEQEAIKVVMDKFYNGQGRFFEKTIAHSVFEDHDCWLVTVYESTILREVTMMTYMVSKSRQIARPEFWDSAS